MTTLTVSPSLPAKDAKDLGAALVRGVTGNSARLRICDEQLIEAYGRLGNVWKVAEELGMVGQPVHRRLKKIGALVPMNVFSDADKARLILVYNAHLVEGTLDKLAKEFGRSKTTLCKFARALGLTDLRRPSTPKLRKKFSVLRKQWFKTHEHPRGFLGGTHTPEARALLSAASIRMWERLGDEGKERMAARLSANRAMRLAGRHGRERASWKAGWREVGGKRCYFRSSWEANYARYLEWLKARGEIQDWAHEPKTFWFEGIKRGTMSYLPDFCVTENSGKEVYHEVKGWMDDRSRTCIDRMGRYHPDVTLLVIDSKAYRAIAKTMASLIPEWETAAKRVAA